MEKRDKRIILCLAHMSGNEMKYIQEAFDQNWVVPLGPNVNKFEEELKRFVVSAAPRETVVEDYPQSIMPHENDPEKLWPVAVDDARLSGKQVVALASGTAAVHLALIALGVKAGDEVVCQSFTFCASSNPVVYLGAKPVFVDSERETWNMDPELLEKAINDRMAKTGRKPKAIIVVYLYGMPAKIAEIKAVADKYGIPLVEDAAEGLGSRYHGRVCGTFGDYGILSFNGNKMITTSGGGALVCPDEEARNKVMFFATQAREGYPYYQHEKIGYNYRLSNICAGIGRGQLTVLDEHIAHHRRLAKFYAEAFKGFDGITFHAGSDSELNPAVGAAAESKTLSNYWLNTITLDPQLKIKGEENAYRTTVKGAVGGAAGVIHYVDSAHTDCEPNANVEALRMWLDSLNIESRPLWKPMHKQPVYKDSPAYVNGTAESIFKVGLCLPSGPLVTLDDAQFIVDAIKDAVC
ncbi:DegT/DnrJ/EryC1/StrS family aminotransferase [Prevotella lacticifex]|uniref:DegT/DnrJ/EryC1/StrS family aminotransferase n=1 Tax=Prevotella lacticifex TaxID=2854755 RepID=UPI001CC39ABE|nr:aminotransferase class I/II-fold pyridoxal phosphate-dependent enzyme [Prevotella lacticifex]